MSPITLKVVLDLIFSVILFMIIFVGVYVLIKLILYFAPQMCRERITEALLSGMLLLLKSTLLGMEVSHRGLSSVITVPEFFTTVVSVSSLARDL